MARLYRFIFRFDFEPCYELADRQGTVLRLLRKDDSNFWDNVGATEQVFQLAATRQRDQKPTRMACNLTVDLSSIGGQIEMEEGMDLGRLHDSEFLRICDSACSSIMEAFEITKIRRCGARYFLSGGDSTDTETHTRRYCATLKKAYIPDLIDKDITVSDAALHFIGEIDNDIKYRLVTGPSAKDDRLKFFSQIPLKDVEEQSDSFLFSADIDLYQENINFRGTHLLRWLKAKSSHLDKTLKIAQFAAER